MSRENGVHIPEISRRTFLRWGAIAGASLFLPQNQAGVQAEKSTYILTAAGDISCSPLDSHFNEGRGEGTFCRMADTATLVAEVNPDYVLAVGDLQYESGTNKEFSESYDRFWGAFKHKTLAAPGNHEYYGNTSTAKGFSDAFGIPQDQRRRLYFSKNIGEYWHLIGLNSSRMNELKINPDLEQLDWLQRDLGANEGKHILAMWHHPHFASVRGTDNSVKDFWDILKAAGAAVILNGHAHWYERLKVENTRQFIVGTGGKSLYPATGTHPFSERLQGSDPGVLKLELGRNFYSWEFLSIFRDNGFIDMGIEYLSSD